MSGHCLKILIATDSFKDCLPALNVAKCLQEGIEASFSRAIIKIFPLADGGEGTLECIRQHKGGFMKTVEVSDALQRPVRAGYLILSNESTAIIELARASGLELLLPAERDALLTSTVGTGELIRDALDSGIDSIILTLGGSATVDGGTGIASSLGFRFFDSGGNALLPCGGNLMSIAQIDTAKVHPLFGKTRIVVACDVKNVLNGPEGAAVVFGPQKGAGAREVRILEEGLKHLSGLVAQRTGFEADRHPGTGAAGGAALFLMAYGRCSISGGFDVVAEMTGLDHEIDQHDIIITGEGKLDHQTGYGKVVASVAKRVGKRSKVLIGVAGKLEGNHDITLEQYGMQQLFSVRNMAADDEDSILNAPAYLRAIGMMIGKNLSRS